MQLITGAELFLAALHRMKQEAGEVERMFRRHHGIGTAVVTFAAGVLVAFCLPTWFLIMALCVLLICAGCACRRR